MSALSQFGVVWPAALALGPLLLILAAVFVGRARVRASRCRALGVRAPAPATRTALLALLPALLMGAALLRPYAGRETIEVPTADEDYMFLVDVSRSMLARDVPPSRMELAKRKMKDLVQELSKSGTGHRFGITVFSGGVYSICPLTEDIGVISQFIDVVSPELVSSLGSNLEEGVLTALERFKGAKSRNGRILLISDGEDNALNVEKVVGVIKSAGVPVDVLGVGTPLGSPIEFEGGRFVRDAAGAIVHSKLNEPSLELIAKAGGGVYVRAVIGDADVEALAAAAAPAIAAAGGSTRSITTYREFGSWLALACAALLVGYALAYRNGFALSAIAIALCVAPSAHAQSPTPASPEEVSARRAFTLYQEGNYKAALDAFAGALQQDPANRAVEQGYASALFKVGSYQKAQETFRKLADSAATGRSYFENTFNEGNTLLAMGRYQDAIDAYTKALDVKPEDEHAIHNRDIARKRLEEAKRSTPTPTDTPTPTPRASPSSPPAPSPSPPPSPAASPSPSPNPSAAPSAAPSASAEPSPSAAPTSSGAPSPQGSPSPGPSGTPQGSPSPGSSPSPAAEGTRQPDGTGTPQSSQQHETTPTERPKEAREEDSLTPSAPIAAQATPALDPSMREAEAWLQSLPDTPLMLRRDKARKDNRNQTW